MDIRVSDNRLIVMVLGFQVVSSYCYVCHRYVTFHYHTFLLFDIYLVTHAYSEVISSSSIDVSLDSLVGNGISVIYTKRSHAIQ